MTLKDELLALSGLDHAPQAWPPALEDQLENLLRDVARGGRPFASIHTETDEGEGQLVDWAHRRGLATRHQTDGRTAVAWGPLTGGVGMLDATITAEGELHRHRDPGFGGR